MQYIIILNQWTKFNLCPHELLVQSQLPIEKNTQVTSLIHNVYLVMEDETLFKLDYLPFTRTKLN